jgi:hypothetical protein
MKTLGQFEVKPFGHPCWKPLPSADHVVACVMPLEGLSAIVHEACAAFVSSSLLDFPPKDLLVQDQGILGIEAVLRGVTSWS